MSEVDNIITLAKRMAIIGMLVETFEPKDRRMFIIGLCECEAISNQAANILLEEYRVGVA